MFVNFQNNLSNTALGFNFIFCSKIESTLIGGRYFITSEKTDFKGHKREYTVREAKANGEVSTIKSFSTKEQSKDFIKKLY